jgi:hypothetical protein
VTRVGPWMVAAGLALLGAGILSTRANFWKSPAREDHTVALDMRGVDTLDIRHSQIRNLTIGNRPAQVRIKWWDWDQPEGGSMPVTVTRQDNQLRIDRGPGSKGSGEISVEVPPGVKSVSGRNLFVLAEANAGALHLDTFNLTWQGRAESLDIRAKVWPNIDCAAPAERVTPKVTIENGQIGLVRVSIERGEVSLGDMSQVDRIELYVGPEVSLAVNKIDDLHRLEIHPFEGEATPRPKAPEGAEIAAACASRVGYARVL